jgi:hypothetical protein
MKNAHPSNPGAGGTGGSALGFPGRITEAEVTHPASNNQPVTGRPRQRLAGPFWITGRVGRRNYPVPVWKLRPVPLVGRCP